MLVFVSIGGAVIGFIAGVIQTIVYANLDKDEHEARAAELNESIKHKQEKKEHIDELNKNLAKDIESVKQENILAFQEIEVIHKKVMQERQKLETAESEHAELSVNHRNLMRALHSVQQPTFAQMFSVVEDNSLPEVFLGDLNASQSSKLKY